jgi:hypothetical protein
LYASGFRMKGLLNPAPDPLLRATGSSWSWSLCVLPIDTRPAGYYLFAPANGRSRRW